MNRYFAWFGLPGSFVLTMLLSLTALLLAVISPKKDRWLVFAAMAFSSVGDLFLMDFGDLDRIFADPFAMGAAAFMISHLIYTAAYRAMAKKHGCRFLNGGAAIVGLIALGCVIYFTKTCMDRNNFGRFGLSMAYLAIISLNLAAIFSYAWARFRKNPLTLLAAAGAASFFASDFVIGLGMLANISRYNYLIWWLYPIGQILLITAPLLCEIIEKPREA